MRVRTRKAALTEGVTAGVFFGTAAIFIRFLDGLDVFSIAFWRLIIACAALSLITLTLKKTFQLSLIKENFKALLLLGVFLGLHFIFFVSAVKDTTILNATVLVNTTPIFSMFISSLFFKLKPSRLAVFGIITSFVGMCVIGYAEAAIINANESVDGFSSSLKGDIEAVLAALVEALYLNYGRKLRGQMNIQSLMLPIYVSAALIVGVLTFPLTYKTLTFPKEIKTILPLLGLGLLPTALAHTLYFSSLSNLKSFETATMALLEPLGATVLGILIFMEIPAPLFAFGAALILLGIFFVLRERDETNKKE